MTYRMRVTERVVLPYKEPIFCEAATVIRIENDAAGDYIKVRQDGDIAEVGTVCFDREDWPLIRDVIDKMMQECEE